LIEELRALASLAAGGVHLDHLVDIVSPMARGSWRTASGFERHLSVPFVLTALAGCFDAHYDELGPGRSAIEEIVVEMTEFLANQQTTTRWGDPDRIAF